VIVDEDFPDIMLPFLLDVVVALKGGSFIGQQILLPVE
jgi:hypothetical protein